MFPLLVYLAEGMMLQLLLDLVREDGRVLLRYLRGPHHLTPHTHHSQHIQQTL